MHAQNIYRQKCMFYRHCFYTRQDKTRRQTAGEACDGKMAFTKKEENMKNRRLAMVLAVMMAFGSSVAAGCGSAAQSETASSAAAAGSAAEEAEAEEAPAEETPAEEAPAEEAAQEEEVDVTAEGFREDYDSYYSVVSWCQNGDMNIYGEFYYPADFDETKTYPVIIMSHGASVTHEIYEKAGWAEYAASQGWVAYAFDFCGGSKNSLSDGEMETYMTPSTQQADLLAVMDFVESKSFCDQEHLYLMGQSFGGLITSVTAGLRNDEVDGIILMYPAFVAVHRKGSDDAAEADIKDENGGGDAGNDHPDAYYEELQAMDLAELLPAYTGDVLIIHGEADKTTPIEDSINAVENYYADGQAELVTIYGEKTFHAFEIIDEEGRAAAQEALGAFMQAHLAE